MFVVQVLQRSGNWYTWRHAATLETPTFSSRTAAHDWIREHTRRHVYHSTWRVIPA
jgi:hypothetical protein